MKKIGIVVLVVVLLLVIGAELFLFMELKGCVAERTAAVTGQTAGEPASGGTASGEGTAAESQVITMTPEPPPAVVDVTDVPAPTAVPITDVPLPTPVPVTDTPAPTVVPATATPVQASSGSCSSSTGTALNMNVDWRTESLGNGSTRVYVTGKITSYSLDLGATSVTVTVGDQSTTCQVGSLLIGDGAQTVSDLFSTTLDVPSGNTLGLRVDWNAHVTYSGVQLDVIRAEGTVTT